MLLLIFVEVYTSKILFLFVYSHSQKNAITLFSYWRLLLFMFSNFSLPGLKNAANGEAQTNKEVCAHISKTGYVL